MGSGGSRLGGSRRPPPRSHHYRQQQHRRRPGFKRILSSIFVCGTLPSSNSHLEMENDPAEKLVNSSEHGMGKIQFPTKSSIVPNGTVSEFSNHTIETGRSTTSLENSNGEDVRRKAEVIDKGKSLSQNKESVADPESIAKSGVNEASTSYEDQHAPLSESASGRAYSDAVDREISVMDGNVHQNYACSIQSSFPSNGGLVESLTDGVSFENSVGEVMVFHDCETSSGSALSTSTIDDAFQQATPSGLSFLVTERDQGQRDGNVLQVDVVSVSANIPSTNDAELSSRDARRNSRRLFWDAFSRRSSRRNADSRSFMFTTDDSDGLDSHDRWLLDFNTDFLDNGLGGGSRLYGNNNQHPNERRWHSSSEIWERFRDVGRNGIDRRTAATCPSGIHPDGACSCGSMIRAEESGARASISRIVMLAEALFEVLDEIHRQPMSLSLSVVSLPAPESVVDSLPLKYHKRSERSENGDDNAQCYICLAEYEEGDKIRILPCHHEYHMTCVDKWLKEIHGVCPLCRGDVREGSSMKEGAISGSAVH